MSKEQGLGVRPGQVVSAALAAVTAAVLGSTMGVAGTVLGAGLASVVTTVATALYLRSLDRTKQGVRLVRERVRSGASGVVVIEREDPDSAPERPNDRPPVARGLRWGAIVAGSVLAFALGMLAITGYEKLVGGSLSGGTGTTLGGVIHPDSARPHQQQRQEVDVPASTATPGPSTLTVTVVPSPAPALPSTSTSVEPSGTATTSGDASSEPPVTTTAPAGDVPSR